MNIIQRIVFAMTSCLVVLALITSFDSVAAVPARHATLPAVSPDGKSIAFVADSDSGPSQIWIVNVDGSGMRPVANAAEDDIVPSWTSDGKRILYRSSTGETTALRAIGREGGTSTTLVTLVAKGITLSHDGRRIAYAVGPWTHGQVVVASLDAANATAITNDSAGYFNLAWSPDDRRIAATRRDSTGTLQVWVMNADGSHARALTRFTPDDGRPQWPAWSADGRKIAIQAGIYDRRDPTRGTAHIWVLDLATGVATKLAAHTAPQIDETPSWFPDGQHLAFQSNRTGRLEIWIMSADGRAARQITR